MVTHNIHETQINDAEVVFVAKNSVDSLHAYFETPMRDSLVNGAYGNTDWWLNE